FSELLVTLALERSRLRKLVDDGGFARCLERLHATLGVPRGATVVTVLAAACAEDAFDGAGLRRATGQLLASVAPSDRKRGELLAAWLASPADRMVRLDEYVS